MFERYICRVTGLPCCGCSAYCEHRKAKILSHYAQKKEVSESLMAELNRLTDKEWQMLNNMSNNFKLI